MLSMGWLEGKCDFYLPSTGVPTNDPLAASLEDCSIGDQDGFSICLTRFKTVFY